MTHHPKAKGATEYLKEQNLHLSCIDGYPSLEEGVIEAMKAYAKQVAEQALMDAAENAFLAGAACYEKEIRAAVINTKIILP